MGDNIAKEGLVAYGSSDDSENSDGEEEIEPPKIADSIPQSNSSNHNAQKTVKENVSPQAEKEHLSEPHISDEEDFYGNEPVSGLHLPPPKHQENSNTHQDAAQSSAARESTLLSGLPMPVTESKPAVRPSGDDELEEMVRPKPAELAIREKPPPSKKKVIKIAAPKLTPYDSDEDEPAKKKVKPSKGGCKLFSMLPEPKNVSVKAVGRSLIPHTLTRRTNTAATKQPSKKPLKPATVTSHDDSDDEGETLPNFFSIGSERTSAGNEALSANSYTATSSLSVLPPVTRGAAPDDPPLSFGKKRGPTAGSSQPMSSSTASVYGEPSYEQSASACQSYNLAGKDEEEYLRQEAAFAAQQKEDELVPAEELKRLQGKRLYGKEEINIIDVNAEDRIDRTEMIKNLSEETNAHAHSRQFKANAPNTTSKRKHQITYLAHQAKQMELDLKNQWANNRMTKRQTQAKYGF